ncbi:FAD/NAD(P)-binding domain-containing protein [Pleomassaria siparia CBS 279.74]|uniref:FAD/NAD(P)-binding domain-containing protein n=1 Tax=Pleomassaria siparia CBS 279.74 TaxID=1314801 RepID=A0A6G1JQF6_9PLEO|nr:FAD/NAD(P)-binding domain-containing protein [Pleomassaria siparia CBS 279.74]
MPRKPLDVVVLGGSFAGLSVAHHFLDNIIHQLSTFEGAPTYRIVLVSPSTHLYWNICAPRAAVSPHLINEEAVFVPIEPAFSRHPFTEFNFMQGSAVVVDASARKVKIDGRSNTHNRNSGTQTISYHALIIATGTSSHSPLFKLHGTHEDTLTELRQFHQKLESARSIMIVGGGPSGVETAGQLATYYNRASNPRVPRTPKTITLLSGGQRLLSRLPMAVSNKAETKLEKLGVHVVHQVRELSHMQNPNGTASTILNSDMTVTSDLLISATGVTPNTTFLPKAFLNEDGYITADRETLRVYGQGIGDRVYAIGDCASYSRKYLADVYEAVPILMKNLHNDLLSHEYRLQTTTATPNMNIKTLAKSASEPLLGMREGGRWEDKETVLMPITRFGGTGVVRGWRVPGWVVYVLKGRDYAVSKARSAVERGRG